MAYGGRSDLRDDGHSLDRKELRKEKDLDWRWLEREMGLKGRWSVIRPEGVKKRKRTETSDG